MTTAALVAGNTAIMKPAEQSPVVAAKLMEVFQEAGFPPGVVNLLSGVGEDVGSILVNHPQMAIIAFTGSRAVGLAIQESAAKSSPQQHLVKRVITEMGGKNAILVDQDADLDQTVQGVTASAFAYAGQKCSACSRVIVLKEIYDSFLQRLVEATRSLRIAAAEEPACFVGPVIDAAARDRILDCIARSQNRRRRFGARRVLCGAAYLCGGAVRSAACAGRNFRPRSGGDPSSKPGRRPGDGQRNTLCVDRRLLFAQPGEYRARPPGFPRRKPIH
jgi:RHH-type proline utilization regulon transcriptional repressor/proline dehydrogenase/delta 1-pyrroline-5-carboxylate dehydrogenase